MAANFLGLLSLSAYAVSRMAEKRRHRKNLKALRAAGAEEVNPKLMRCYYGATTACVGLVALESVFLPGGSPRGGWLFGAGAAAAALAGGYGLRLWSIHSLGVWWTMGCMSHPGLRPLRVGPYRFLNHPEYGGRLVEFCGLGLLCGARYATAVGASVLAALAWRAARLEKEDQHEAEGGPPARRHTGRSAAG